MHASARQASILKALEQGGVCRVGDLASQLAVSDETVRRDIKTMENKGLVERVHGGAHLRNLFREADFQKRLDQNAAAKRQIARLAASRVKNGSSLMIDTGSTTAYVGRALADHNDLLVVTNCSRIAGDLARAGRNRVYMAGGEFRSDDKAVFGPPANEFVRQFRVGMAILSIGAISLEDGFMDYHLAEAEFSRAMIAQANQIVVVADHGKFGDQASVRVCGFEAIDMVITDQPPGRAFRDALDKAGVAILTPPAA